MGRPNRYNHGYPSSTGLPGLIDKPGLRYWYGSKGTAECERVKKKSQQIGREVHNAIEHYLQGRPVNECCVKLDKNQVLMFTQLVNWCKRVGLNVISMEYPLYWYCEKHHTEPHLYNCTQDCPDDCICFTLAGTPDVICTFNGWKMLSVLDWKTDAVPRDLAGEIEKAAGYYWQNSSYALMYNRTHGTNINTAYTVRSVTKEKVKDKTNNKKNMVLPPWVTVTYSDDYTFAVYKFKSLKPGIEEVKMLRKIYKRVKNK